MSRKINYMKKEILAELASSEENYTAQTLSQALSYDQADDFADLVKTLAKLEQAGDIAITSNGTLSIKQDKETYTGYLPRMHVDLVSSKLMNLKKTFSSVKAKPMVPCKVMKCG